MASTFLLPKIYAKIDNNTRYNFMRINNGNYRYRRQNFRDY